MYFDHVNGWSAEFSEPAERGKFPEPLRAYAVTPSRQVTRGDRLAMTHILTNPNGNLWHLTTPEGQLVDAVIATSQAVAALAYQAPGRVEVLRRAHQW
jgi:hypothetical protein